jgi:uncharacterized protein (DUF2147 family)
MREFRKALVAVALLAGAVAPAWAQSNATIVGNYTRPNGDPVQVFECNGLLCGRISGGEREGFEMLHGMRSTAAGEWQGSEMKHPGMPGFMTFNGTVTLEGASLSVRGCAIGQAMCDAEVWTRQP